MSEPLPPAVTIQDQAERQRLQVLSDQAVPDTTPNTAIRIEATMTHVEGRHGGRHGEHLDLATPVPQGRGQA